MKSGHDSIFSVIHKTAKGLHDARIMNEITMREFDALCLSPVKTYQPNENHFLPGRVSVMMRLRLWKGCCGLAMSINGQGLR